MQIWDFVDFKMSSGFNDQHVAKFTLSLLVETLDLAVIEGLRQEAIF